MIKIVKGSPCFVISYDKSNILQEEEMDVFVRFCDDKSGKVKTRFFDYFDAKSLYEHLNNSILELPK